MDTIYALASAPGRAGVAVFRISGPEAVEIAGAMLSNLPPSRGVRRLFDANGAVIDEALVLYFAENHSFTGETVVEFQSHGSMAVVAAVSARVAELGGRMAEPGEFTRRALENGRLDLAQVEGLADLIDAETEAQRKQALRVFQGSLGHTAERWRTDLIRAAALIEATIDFVDEDVPIDVYPEVSILLTRTLADMTREIAGAGIAERIRHGFEVAIVGRPNVGKSTLLNRLAGRAAAITSEIAGTTRDVIEVRMDLAGLPVTLLDTAGVRDTVDRVEQLGVQLAQDRARAADLRIFLVEAGDVPPIAPVDGDLVLQAKADLGGLGVSGLTGAGVDKMVGRVTEILKARAVGAGLAVRDRHRQAIQSATLAIGSVQNGMRLGASADLLADDIRAALRAVDMIVGRVDVEDLLDEIFSSFCIGK
ncbi:tRNA uridine-5-carboxymethylaminomethyl(34) synthesis GTPase MnmE [Loktanella sp. DJP18]|uniref:tRNA uridine-5-carboxymethylaminomethyl(34) synthesis GTPase MnmE n=1 Tax=Loktanella sp. DJP18 TaxID=3409788 RepID=UPI003BB542F8